LPPNMSRATFLIAPTSSCETGHATRTGGDELARGSRLSWPARVGGAAGGSRARAGGEGVGVRCVAVGVVPGEGDDLLAEGK
jgi:hypothetical protein